MGEEVKMSENERNGGDVVDDERVHEWEMGLPSVDDLTPLSTQLIPQELASAFSISPEPYKTLIDVNRASQNTLSSLRGGSFTDERNRDPIVVEAEETEMDLEGEESSRKLRKLDEEAEAEADSNSVSAAAAGGTLKWPRLVWTPQLHKRFVDVVGHLGIKNAVPKTIMQLMNVEGLTRENVASHLQKYRLYLKRMRGLSSEGPSSSDQLFASTPVPQSLHENSGGGANQMQMMPMVVYGHHMVNQYHHGCEASSYNVMQHQQRDWSGNKYYPHHHVAPNDSK